MPRRMAVSITLDAVRARRKTVTRRHANTWRGLKPGDELTLIEKGMGLPKGARQVVVATVEVVDVTVEPLLNITDEDVAREGFPDMTASEFVDMWCESHNISFKDQAEAMTYEVRRIEWRYVDAAKHRPVPSHATAGLPKTACAECGDWWPCDNAGDWTIDNPAEAEALRDDEEEPS